MRNNKIETFTGSIDDLLTHCSQMDLDQVEDQIKQDEKQECLNLIMNDC